MKKALVSLLALSVVFAGCATNQIGTTYVPVVDLKSSNKDDATYQRDLGECQVLARQRDNAMQQAAAGAIAGALLGAIIAPKDYRSNLANRGALMGAAAGGGQAIQTQEGIIKQCLSARGYVVLN